VRHQVGEVTADPTFRDPALEEAPAFPRDPDFDDADLERRASGDPLDVLDELAGDVELPDVIIPNRLRPGWAVRYSVEIDNDELKRWRDKATERKKKLSAVAPSVDDLRFACLAMAALCRVIIHDDQELYDGDRPVTFGHPRIWRLYDAQRAADAVRRFYGSDPYLMATFDALCAQAGVGEDVEPLDPTRPSAD
jgi:hypothetical protein